MFKQCLQHHERQHPFFLMKRLFSVNLQFSLDKDYYRILGVARTASQLEIKKEFFRQAKLYHPDIVHSKRTINYKEAQDKFKDINEAY